VIQIVAPEVRPAALSVAESFNLIGSMVSSVTMLISYCAGGRPQISANVSFSSRTVQLSYTSISRDPPSSCSDNVAGMLCCPMWKSAFAMLMFVVGVGATSHRDRCVTPFASFAAVISASYTSRSRSRASVPTCSLTSTRRNCVSGVAPAADSMVVIRVVVGSLKAPFICFGIAVGGTQTTPLSHVTSSAV
jgi:hypothetical protein